MSVGSHSNLDLYAPARSEDYRGAPKRWSRVLLAVVAVFSLAVSVRPQPGSAQSTRGIQAENAPVRHVVLTLFKSKTFHLDKPFATAVVGSPDIADVLPMSDHSLYVLGKKIGTTNVSVYDQTMKLASVVDVEVAIDAR